MVKQIWLCAFAMLIVGCSIRSSPAVPFSTRYIAGGLDPEDALMIVLISITGHTVPFSRSLETRVTECIGDALTRTHHTVRMVPAGDTFRHIAAPDGYVVLTESISAGNQEHLSAKGVRYLITVTISEGRRNWRPRMGGGAGPTVFLGASWEHWSIMKASIIDVRRARTLGNARADASGESTFLLGNLLVPFVLLSSADKSACRTVGEEVARVPLPVSETREGIPT